MSAPLCAAATPGKADTPAGPAQVRAAVAQALPFLEKEGLAWMKQRKCIACHHGPFLLWSHNEARLSGLDVDRRKLDDWTGQALALYLPEQKNHLAKKNGCVEATHLLLGQVSHPAEDAKTAESMQALAAILANGQREDGSWKYEGQEIKRPDKESDEDTTLWAILALAEHDSKAGASVKARGRALAWLKANPQGAGNESAALRLLIESLFGDGARAEALEAELLARQQSDGGWAWRKGKPSDAFATGQSLYVLARVGRTGTDATLRRAWQFLLALQRPDGSWFSPSRKPPGRDNDIAVYWGSAWAVIGLARSLPAEVR